VLLEQNGAPLATLTHGLETLLYRTIDSKRFLAHAAFPKQNIVGRLND
jgi:hypothetical protein